MWRVVLMRPEVQSREWKHQIEQHGVEVSLLPMLTITPLILEQTVQEQALCVDRVIVTSQNAAWHAPRVLFTKWAERKTWIATMGHATTQAVLACGGSVTYTASPGSQSETLLALPEWQSDAIANSTVLLLTGAGGRSVLMDTLTQRKATVVLCAVYRQSPQAHDLAKYFSLWHVSMQRHCFVATSGNMLEALVRQTPTKYMAWLRSQSIIVVSSRVEAIAKLHGFREIHVASGADLESILNRLHNIVKTQDTRE